MSLSPTPKVSIILPTCDRAEMSRRCLDALSAQTHPNLEVIVVDDGSRDDTPAMLKDFAAEHEKFPLIVLTNPSNRGANFSRNRGVAASNGELVAFLDSDCLAEPNWIEELVVGETQKALLNSTIIAIGTAVGVILLGAPAAYALSRFKFNRPGNKDFTIWFLSQRLFFSFYSSSSS